MSFQRRNFLKFAGGCGAGLAFTPVPYKALDDVSIWSQNWSWIPRPIRGELTERYTACTLCSAGCAVMARCVAGQPYQLTGVANAPFGRSTLCPAGLAAHQLPYAPTRVHEATSRRVPLTLGDALQRVDALNKAANSVLVVDGRPGRSASLDYQRIAAADPKWRYAVAPRGTGALARSRRMTGQPVGFDQHHVKTLLSFGRALA